jgi:hypothetical protein
VKHIYFSISSHNNSESFVYVVIPKRLLTTDFTVISDGTETQHSIIQSGTNSFMYFTLGYDVHNVEIEGMLLADVAGPTGVPDGRVDMRDIRTLAKFFAAEVGDPRYIATNDINSDGIIDMKDIGVAAKDFGKTYP